MLSVSFLPFRSAPLGDCKSPFQVYFMCVQVCKIKHMHREEHNTKVYSLMIYGSHSLNGICWGREILYFNVLQFVIFPFAVVFCVCVSHFIISSYLKQWNSLLFCLLQIVLSFIRYTDFSLYMCFYSWREVEFNIPGRDFEISGSRAWWGGTGASEQAEG